MKKTYMIPTLKVVKVQTTSILAGSLEIKNKDAEQALGRQGRFSRWEEDDFESEE